MYIFRMIEIKVTHKVKRHYTKQRDGSILHSLYKQSLDCDYDGQGTQNLVQLVNSNFLNLLNLHTSQSKENGLCGAHLGILRNQ